MKLLLSIVFATLLMGCEKQVRDAGVPPPLSAPIIKITSPTDLQHFSAGQTVTITATITDNDQLDKVRLLVSNKEIGVEVLRLEKHLDVKSYTLSESFTAAASRWYTIKIEAVDLNHNNAKTQMEVSSE